MKELLLSRKSKFILYLIATFMFIIDHFAQMGVNALIMGAIEKRDLAYYKMVVLITAVYIIYAPLNFLISRLLRIRYMRDTILDVRKQAFKKIINMPFKQYSQKSKDVYISNLINDVNNFENKFFISFLNFLINVGMFIISLVILIVLDLKLSIAMLMFSVLLYFLASLFTKKTTSLEQEISTSGEAFTTEMSNTFNGLEILKLNNIEDKFLHKSVAAINRLEKRKYMANVFNHLQRDVIYVLSFAVSVAVVIYLGFQLQNGMALSEATLLFLLSTSVSNYLINAFPMWNQVKASTAIYKKIAKPEESTVKAGRGTKDFKFEDKIEVSHVNFSFGNKQILKDASFTIEKGKKYLIKGVSGAGKSTLINLLAMVYDDYEGNIKVDQVDYRDISEKSFHEKVAFIYQDVFLFEDTIKNNIALYQDIPEERINYAIKVAGLEEFIKERKEGINERLAENGKNLSGGQRQRISIARAIAKNAEILFIDEGTSSLNEELGREIEKTFLQLNSTVIAISHRYYEGVTENYDYVIEIKNGKVHCFPAKDYFEEVITW
ncbi:subfamily B ATP-binding cassette protein MsbA [Herbinix hemicellulosilytica]|uniref:Putative membrane protein n=1 Tax=Herbinix hemicellulosilytica TaxID=1564487 RepID=A0A0H5SG53_HERHM|nr:ABC transporter ATP-binding protein [Herbinix hemicellulosilytica]RBP60057.1 subfamily B ATP-binding cassette protein MsbA [Herbinix hemicellulosilytica]CRZ33781.1 putative membrane protein [Herbinix hemicellulosilytica]